MLGFVTAVQDGTVQVNLDKQQLSELEQYNPASFHSEDIDRGGLGPLDTGQNERWNYGLDEVLSNLPNDQPRDRPVDETHPMTPRYPTGEEIAPEDDRPTVISEETFVWDNQGYKLGQVHGFAVETSTGRPVRLTLQRGFISQPDLVIPIEWAARYGPEGIALRVAKEKVEELIKGKT